MYEVTKGNSKGNFISSDGRIGGGGGGGDGRFVDLDIGRTFVVHHTRDTSCATLSILALEADRGVGRGGGREDE